MSIENEDFSVGDSWTKHKEFKKPFVFVLDDIKDDQGQVVRKRGQKLLIRRLDMPALLKLGIANEMDFMTKALMNSEGNSKSPQEAVADAIKTAENIARMEKMVDKVCVEGIMKPKIHALPEHDNARQAGLFYVDDIPWEDRQELFSVIFDTEGLSDFREEQEPGVGDVADVQDVQLPANGPVADVPAGSTEGVLSQ